MITNCKPCNIYKYFSGFLPEIRESEAEIFKRKKDRKLENKQRLKINESKKKCQKYTLELKKRMQVRNKERRQIMKPV